MTKRQVLWWGIIAAFVAVVCVVAAFALLFRAYGYQPYRLVSKSMAPTLLAGDCVLVDTNISVLGALSRRDVVVVEYPLDPSKVFIERLIGLPGDTIEIKDKQLFVNGVKQEEAYIVSDPYVYKATDSPRDNYGPKKVPEGQLFVLGDNRDHSNDSRFWGFAETSRVKGKVTYIYWSSDRGTLRTRWGRIGKEVY